MDQEILYDFIFMDVNMPIMDGLTATREIKSKVVYNSKLMNYYKIIVVTAFSDSSDRSMAF